MKNKLNNYYVYILTFPDEKKYIGITRQEPERRWQNGKGYKNQSKVYEAIQKYGWDNIRHDIYKANVSSEEAQQTEIELIKKYNSIENGYNVYKGGDLGGNEWVEIEYNGRVYLPSELAELSEAEVTPHDITNRIRRNWDVERAISQQPQKREYKREYKGNIYTIKELIELPECVVDRKTLIYRISKGWDIERALTQPKNVKKQPYTKKILYKDKEISVPDAIKIAQEEYGIKLTEGDIRGRINRGWSVEDVLSRRKIGGNNDLFWYDNKRYTTIELLEIAKEKYGLNISRSYLLHRIKNGMTVEEAISTPLKRNRHKN